MKLPSLMLPALTLSAFLGYCGLVSAELQPSPASATTATTPAAKSITGPAAALHVLEPELQADAPECVILLHGLARTHKSMNPLAKALQTKGYRVVNVGYPSRKFPVATLTDKAIPPALAQCRQQPSSGISIVAHSLGGILVRYYLSEHKIPELKRVVMLAPPNKGSEVVDKLKALPPYEWLNGPVGEELGTEPTSIPNRLGPVTFDLGVIAGTRSINLILSLYLPNPDDGKVSVESTKIEGMRDFTTLPVSHPFIMKNKAAIAQVLHYLEHGQFLCLNNNDQHASRHNKGVDCGKEN